MSDESHETLILEDEQQLQALQDEALLQRWADSVQAGSFPCWFVQECSRAGQNNGVAAMMAAGMASTAQAAGPASMPQTALPPPMLPAMVPVPPHPFADLLTGAHQHQMQRQMQQQMQQQQQQMGDTFAPPPLLMRQGSSGGPDGPPDLTGSGSGRGSDMTLVAGTANAPPAGPQCRRSSGAGTAANPMLQPAGGGVLDEKAARRKRSMAEANTRFQAKRRTQVCMRVRVERGGGGHWCLPTCCAHCRPVHAACSMQRSPDGSAARTSAAAQAAAGVSHLVLAPPCPPPPPLPQAATLEAELEERMRQLTGLMAENAALRSHAAGLMAAIDNRNAQVGEERRTCGRQGRAGALGQG